MRVRIEGAEKDVNILDVTAENFICPKGEEHLYHCRMEMVQFDPKTGKRLSTPRMQVFGRKFFESYGLHNLRQQGYTIDILHDPKKWEEEHKEQLEAAKKAKEEAKAKAAEAKRKAEREAMKAEIIAELKEQGLLKETKKASAKEE